MHILLLFASFPCLFAVTESQGGAAGSSVNYCDALSDCLSKALRTEQDCQTQLERQRAGAPTTSPGRGGQACSSTVQASIKDNMRRLNGMKGQQIEQFKQCIADRKSQSYDVGAIGQKQRLTCERAVISVKNTTSTTSGFSGRKVRQASGAKSTQWTRSKGGRGKSHGTGVGERSCRSGVQYAYSLCKRLEKCCSESTICKLKFEISDLHDQMRQLQLDSATKQHDCVKAKISSDEA